MSDTEQSAHQAHQAAQALAIKRRVEDSIKRAHQLLLAHNEENAHTDQLRDEYWSVIRQPITVADLTVEEREAATKAAHLALALIDNDEQLPETD